MAVCSILRELVHSSSDSGRTAVMPSSVAAHATRTLNADPPEWEQRLLLSESGLATMRKYRGLMMRRLGLLAAMALMGAGCGGDSATNVSPVPPWTEQEVTFSFGADELYGVLALPPGDGPHPAIVLVDGAASTTTGVRAGTASAAFISFSRAMVRDGYAVLRYDPPGVGRSTGEYPVEIIDDRVAEAMAALHHLQMHPELRSDNIGFWGASQGSWVIAKAAAEHPDDVGFIISVSGAGISVADQQVWGVEMQTRAAGRTELEVAKAGLLARLLIDWQLTDPVYREATAQLTATVGTGPWYDFARIVYESGDSASLGSIEDVIAILEAVEDEPWTDALHLKELYIPRLRSATPDDIVAIRRSLDTSLRTDPKDFMMDVRCPVLAFFGEDDIVQPTETSAALFEEYLTAAGNSDFEIRVIPGVGHDIDWTTPGYDEAVSRWLEAHK